MKQISFLEEILKDRDILIVDDMKNWQRQLSSLFCYYKISTASNYDEAVNILNKFRFKIAIVDIRLEDYDDENKDGIALLDKIQKSEMETKVILTTGYSITDKKRIQSQYNKLISFLWKEKINWDKFENLVKYYL